jgi:multidrug efflux pump subunit AcrA (membrane-fusion protein)
MNIANALTSIKRRRYVVGAVVAAALGSAWRMHHDSRAYADLYHQWVGAPPPADRGPAPEPSVRRLVAEGRLVARPGAEVIVGAEIPGKIIRLLVQEKDTVHAGDTIAEIDCDEERAAVVEAQARLAEIDVDIPLAESRLARVARLAPTGGVSVDELEQRQRDVQAVQARRQALAAMLERLEVHVRKADVRAPIDGTITTRFAHPGQTLPAAGKLVTITDLTQTRLEAEVNEFDAPAVKIGAPATITAEGCPDQVWHATVEEIPDTIAPRQLRPQDPGRPTDTGVLLVKLVPQGPVPFKLHQRLEITIEAPGR